MMWLFAENETSAYRPISAFDWSVYETAPAYWALSATCPNKIECHCPSYECFPPCCLARTAQLFSFMFPCVWLSVAYGDLLRASSPCRQVAKNAWGIGDITFFGHNFRLVHSSFVLPPWHDRPRRAQQFHVGRNNEEQTKRKLCPKIVFSPCIFRNLAAPVRRFPPACWCPTKPWASKKYRTNRGKQQLESRHEYAIWNGVLSRKI